MALLIPIRSGKFTLEFFERGDVHFVCPKSDFWLPAGSIARVVVSRHTPWHHVPIGMACVCPDVCEPCMLHALINPISLGSILVIAQALDSIPNDKKGLALLFVQLQPHRTSGGGASGGAVMHGKTRLDSILIQVRAPHISA
jgi:hypothetical protein